MANNDADMALLEKTTLDGRFPTSKMEPTDVKFHLRKRYLVMLLMFFGCAMSYLMKANLSIVLMEIAYPKYIFKENRTIYQASQVDWNSKEVGFIIGATTYGVIPGILIAGVLVKKYGGATLFGCGLLLSSVFVCVTPVILKASYFWLFVIVRVIEGFGTGVIDGSCYEICLLWSPIDERARFTSVILTSGAFGVMLSNIVTGYGIHYSNWQTVFFATGSSGIILAIVWLLCVRNRPCDDKFMSKIERRYLEAEINKPSEKDLKILSYPWKETFTSKPVWAYLNEWFCCGWSSGFVLFCLPFYVKDVTKLDVKNVSVMSSIPLLCSIMSEFIFAFIHDRIIRPYSAKMKSSIIHRIILSTAHSGVAISLVIMALWVNFEANLVLISFIRILIGIKYVYYNVIPLDVFHRYAGFIGSLSSASLVIANCLTPLLIGIIVTNHERSQWSLFFGIIVVFNIFSVLVYNLYGSFELQSWASVPVTKRKPYSGRTATMASQQVGNISKNFQTKLVATKTIILLIDMVAERRITYR